MKIGFLQLNSTVGDFAANVKKLAAGYEKAVGQGAEFVLAPELFLCGYPPRDLLLRNDFIEANLAALDETAKKPVPCRFVLASWLKPGAARARLAQCRGDFAERENGVAYQQMPVAHVRCFRRGPLF